MPVKLKLTEEALSIIYARYQQNERIKDLCKIYGVSETGLRQHLIASGRPLRMNKKFSGAVTPDNAGVRVLSKGENVAKLNTDRSCFKCLENVGSIIDRPECSGCFVDPAKPLFRYNQTWRDRLRDSD